MNKQIWELADVLATEQELSDDVAQHTPSASLVKLIDDFGEACAALKSNGEGAGVVARTRGALLAYVAALEQSHDHCSSDQLDPQQVYFEAREQAQREEGHES